VTEPVRSTNGWHILQVEADRPYVPPTAAQLRPQLIQAVSQRKLSAAAQALVNKARIEMQ
jgi:peptidyl-prolyl cis-trans isomerase C